MATNANFNPADFESSEDLSQYLKRSEAQALALDRSIPLAITNSTEGTSSTGSITTAGGIGIAKSLYVGNTGANAIVAAGGANVGGRILTTHAAGSAAIPSVQIVNANSGLYAASNQLCLTGNGVLGATVGDGGLSVGDSYNNSYELYVSKTTPSTTNFMAGIVSTGTGASSRVDITAPIDSYIAWSSAANANRFFITGCDSVSNTYRIGTASAAVRPNQLANGLQITNGGIVHAVNGLNSLGNLCVGLSTWTAGLGVLYAQASVPTTDTVLISARQAAGPGYNILRADSNDCWQTYQSTASTGFSIGLNQASGTLRLYPGITKPSSVSTGLTVDASGNTTINGNLTVSGSVGNGFSQAGTTTSSAIVFGTSSLNITNQSLTYAYTRIGNINTLYIKSLTFDCTNAPSGGSVSIDLPALVGSNFGTFPDHLTYGCAIVCKSPAGTEAGFSRFWNSSGQYVQLYQTHGAVFFSSTGNGVWGTISWHAT